MQTERHFCNLYQGCSKFFSNIRICLVRCSEKERGSKEEINSIYCCTGQAALVLVRVRVIHSTVPDEQIKDIIWAQVWCEASLADLWHNWHCEGEEALKRQCAISKRYENKTDVDVQTEFGCLTAKCRLLCSCLIGYQGHKGEATQAHPCFIVLDMTIMSSSCELTVMSTAGYKVTGN